jgi:nucleoside 2-deoxyribosyltransferase
MNHLKLSRAYLAGPIDHAHDDGIGWRDKAKSYLSDMDVVVLDPTHKSFYGKNLPEEVGEEKKILMQLKEEGRFDELRERMKIIRHIDLRMTDIADFVIAKIDLSIPMCGTWEEIFNANRQKKPVLIFIEQGKKAAANWLFGMCDHKYIFNSLDEVLDYIKNIDNGTIPMDGRWTLLDHQFLMKEDK